MGEMNAADVYPLPPIYDETAILSCEKANDFGEVFHEWLRYSGQLTAFFAVLEPESSVMGNLPDRYYVLRGILMRICKLINAQLALCYEQKFGDASEIIDRCIMESCVNLQWIIEEDGDVEIRLERFLADGLKADLKFADVIEENISRRNGNELPIETRMKSSIKKCCEDVGLTEENVKSSKKIPNLYQRMPQSDSKETNYSAQQRMGSHAVHGTWANLQRYYLDHDGQKWTIWPHPHSPDFRRVGATVLSVLDTLESFCSYVFDDKKLRIKLCDEIDSSHTKFFSIFERACLANDHHRSNP